MTNSSDVVQLSIYLVPSFLAILSLAFTLAALFAATFSESMLHATWNVLYDMPSSGGFGGGSMGGVGVLPAGAKAAGPKETFIYVIRLWYQYRGSTIDFASTHLGLVLLGVDDTRQTAFRLPWAFLSAGPHNVHCTFDQEGGTVKFLLIRERPLLHLEKIAFTHDHVGAQLNLVSVEVQQTTKSEGYQAPVGAAVASVSLEVAVKRQAFASKLVTLPLEGEFTVEVGTTLLDFIGPLYLYLSVVTNLVADYLVAYYGDWSVKPTYVKWESLQHAVFLGLTYFLLLFGFTSVVHDAAKHCLAGKPRAYMKVLYGLTAAWLLLGAYFSADNVAALDPNSLQQVLLDGTLLPYFLHLWVQASAAAAGLGFVYCLSIVLTYLLLMKMLFK